MGIKRIKGDIVYTNNGKMELTVDKSGKYIKNYNPKQICRLKKLILKLLNINNKDIIYRRSQSLDSQYIIFRYNGNRYMIRSSTYTYKIPKDSNKILLNCRYIQQNFIIEASIYKYTPEVAVRVVREIDKSLSMYQLEENQSKIHAFVKDIYDETGIYNKYFYDDRLYPYNMAMELAGMYMDENHISDNKYNTQFIALSSIMENELDKINYYDI